ncbi:MAG: hypothetical protein KAT85_04095 [candidate division Zixibacteria bacterium]|jgi:hypothetical protein|nr:hypothetical protein [candidate division Zixibacteria bacterium]
MKKIICHILLLALVALSCSDPFSGRGSEPPSESQGTYLTPVDPEIVLFNLENSYNERIIANFVQCLDTNFVFHFDHLLFGEFADSGWTYNSEVSLTEKMFANYRKNADTRSLWLSMRIVPGLDRVEDTIAVLHREYQLNIITDIDKAIPDTIRYVGTATFELVEMGFNLWSIREWRDYHQTSTDTSWADFKNGFR